MAEYLITGGEGQLGVALGASAPASAVALGRKDLDVGDAGAVARVMAQVRPAVVVHAGAYTDVDGCENDRQRAWRVNAEGTAHLARACAAADTRLIYVSTDYVFAGHASEPYEPGDPLQPASAYGASKLGGELAVRTLLPRDHTIVRTSWVFAARGRNFVRTILRLAAERSELRVVNDQRGRPTYADDLAAWIWALADRGAVGTYHACNAGECTWHAFAQAIVAQAGLATLVLPVSTAEFPRPARRPAYSVLSTAAFTAATGIEPRSWKDALDEVLRDLQAMGGRRQA